MNDQIKFKDSALALRGRWALKSLGFALVVFVVSLVAGLIALNK